MSAQDMRRKYLPGLDSHESSTSCAASQESGSHKIGMSILE